MMCVQSVLLCLHKLIGVAGEYLADLQPGAFEWMLQLAEEVLFDNQLVQPRYSSPDLPNWT